MNIRYVKTFVLIVLAASASLVLADPPGRVGRIAYTQGEVLFRNNADDDFNAAQVNWPVTSQNLISTGRNARTEIRVGSAAVRIDSNSELEIAQLDDVHFNLHLIYGSAYVRINNPELAKEFVMSTPQGRVQFSGPSRIRIDAERTPDTTVLSVLDGATSLAGAEGTFTVRAGKRAAITAADIHMTTLRPNELQDDFDRWTAARDQRDDQSQAVRYVSAETTGYEELDTYGNWQTTSEYGAVWTPRAVASDWAPYQVGRWTWVEPWGWTWVDSAPWGYAPFHYGRWVWFRHRWCWAPGAMVARPVWAPAMVGWVGGANWNATFSVGAAPAVGWFPLAPREVYVPSYRVSPNYIRQINITHVTNITNITVVNGFASVPPHERYQNQQVRNAISVMPQNQFNSGRTVVVSATPARINPRNYLVNAPVSAVMPASNARPHGFDHPASDRVRIEAPHTAPTAGQPLRLERSNTPQSAPPPVQTPRNANPEFLRKPDVFIDKHTVPTVTTPVVTSTTPPTTVNPELIRRQHLIINQRDAQPAFRPHEKEAPPAAAPISNPTQDAERERKVREAQKQAEAQARAQREQQHAPQAVPAPVKQMAPREVNEGQKEHPHEKAAGETRREERPAGGKELNEGGRRPERRENVEGR